MKGIVELAGYHLLGALGLALLLATALFAVWLRDRLRRGSTTVAHASREDRP